MKQAFSVVSTVITDRRETHEVRSIFCASGYGGYFQNYSPKVQRPKSEQWSHEMWEAENIAWGCGSSWNLWSRVVKKGNIPEKELQKSALGKLLSLWLNTKICAYKV